MLKLRVLLIPKTLRGQKIFYCINQHILLAKCNGDLILKYIANNSCNDETFQVLVFCKYHKILIINHLITYSCLVSFISVLHHHYLYSLVSSTEFIIILYKEK